MKSNIRKQICKLSHKQNTTQQRKGTIIKIKTKCSPIRDSRGDKSNYLCLMLQICSNGRSEEVNKRLRRGNKRMWFLINLKEEQQGDLVNPSFICCLRPLVCLLHNVVFKRGGRTSVCGGDNTVLLPSKWNVNRFNCTAEGVQRFPAFCRFYCSLSFAAAHSPPPFSPPPNLLPPPPLPLVRGFICSILALKITNGWGNNWVCAITASLMRERIQEFVLPLSPTLHAQPSGRQLSLSSAFSLKHCRRRKMLSHGKMVVNTFITCNKRYTHHLCTQGLDDGESRYANLLPGTDQNDKKTNTDRAQTSKERKRQTKQKKRFQL